MSRVTPSRPLVSHGLGIGDLCRGEPNKLDAVHLAAGNQAARLRSLERPVERLPSCVGLLLIVPVRSVLSIEFGAHQFDVAGAHFGAVREWPDVLPTIGKDADQDA